MASLETKVFLCTANVGTVFESLDTMMEPYVCELAKKIDELKPQFVAIHMQEMGGKHYKQSMQAVDTFFKYFLSNEIVKEYDRYLIIADSDFTNEITFTSLCNIYLIHSSLLASEVEIYNFDDKNFYKYLTKQIYTGNLQDNSFINKERFVKKFFPEFSWSRKGFVQTKWRIRNKIINLVNVHLFHDASNLVALSVSPSLYSENRRRALKYTLEKINENRYLTEFDSYTAIFGDFNFRLDLGPLIDKYTSTTKNSGINENEESTAKTFKDTDKRDIFVISEKKFKWNRSSSIQDEINTLREFDREIQMCHEPLYEFPYNFPPSYPFVEDLVNVEKYMETRCPAWCDRVVFDKNMSQLVTNEPSTEYDMIGLKAPMGDHKPVYLSFKFISSVSKEDRNNICDSNNNNLLEGKHQSKDNSPNYAFINYNLTDLKGALTDLHDNAWFTYTHPLNCLKQVGYPSYILDLKKEATSPGRQLFSMEFNPYEQPEIYEQTNIVLNQWLRSVGEIIIQLHQSSSIIDTNISRLSEQGELLEFVNICYRQNPNDTSSINKLINCECVLPLENLRHTYFVKFFINSLNGNFFKLKHLLSYLNEQIGILKQSISSVDKFFSSTNNNKLKYTIHDLKNPLDISHKSLFILTECHAFLNSTCILNLFRRELQKSNRDKRLSIYFNFYSNKNFQHSNVSGECQDS